MNIWNDETKIKHAIKNSLTKGEAIRKLGMSPKGSITRKKLNVAIEKFKIDISHFSNNTFHWENYNGLAEIVKNSLSITEVLEQIGLTPRSGNFLTAQKYINQYKLDTSHFNPFLAGQKKKAGTKYQLIPIEEILEGFHPTFRTYNLKLRLIKEGVKEYKCEECGLIEWRGNSITLDLDHINGISTDHRLENLRLLCPNCHSQTPTFKGRNNKRNKGT